MPPVTSEEHLKHSHSPLKDRRFKLSRACDRCRRRRIKCDEGHPCQACITANSACTFEEPGKRSHPHKSKRTATLEDRMQHLETLIQAIPAAVFAAGLPTIGSQMQLPHEPSPQSIASLMSTTQSSYPSGVPPPSLHSFPLTNPSTHFTQDSGSHDNTFQFLFETQSPNPPHPPSRMSLTASYLYVDEEGYTRWQGETSGLPLLDLLVEHHAPPPGSETSPRPKPSWVDEITGSRRSPSAASSEYPPSRAAQRREVNPEAVWRFITSNIAPELMDSLVQCYLSTSYYILPFLHVPTFLADYGNPKKWGEPGFAAFIVAICCLASRHMDDLRVRADPSDGVSSGTQWFELLGRLRTLPIADCPTLYTIQADLIAAVYAVGLGKLSQASALLSEAISVCVDAGLHRSAENYDMFDHIEDEVRKRTFWCVYLWDKQLCAQFGRPPMIRLRDCDVGEPSAVDDEFITHEGVGTPPPATESRMSAFICSVRILIVLESVVDIPPVRYLGESSPFLIRASAIVSGAPRRKVLREEEALLDEINRSIPPHWAHTPETLGSEDVIRVTQAERLHCAEHFVRLLIYRHRFTELFAERTSPTPGAGGDERQKEEEGEAMKAAHGSALQIIAAHLHIAAKGLMTYYGVHVIHQLTQAGRTLVAILLNCKSEPLQSLIPTALDALRSCVGLLRRFSGRYVCGQRSGDLMEEFCRLTQIPLEATPRPEGSANNNRPAWIRPIRKKNPSAPHSASSDSPSQQGSPEVFTPSDYFIDMAMTPSSSAQSPLVYNQGPSNSLGSQILPDTSIASRSQSQYPILGGNGGQDVASPYLPDMNSMTEVPQMYSMSPEEMMALFSEGSIDMNGFGFGQAQQSLQAFEGAPAGVFTPPHSKKTGTTTS